MITPFSVQALANAFEVLGALLGLPSLAVLGLYTLYQIRLRLSVAPTAPQFGPNPDAILSLLRVMTETVGALGRFAEAVGHFVFSGLAIVAAAALVIAVAFWTTGKGLEAHAGWARLSAFTLLLMTLLPSLLLAVSLHNLPRLIMFGVVALCALGLHALFAGQMPPLQ